jgi:uncharacterized protein YecE (DUF72 family)
MARVRFGISGWVYPPWRGAFYPRGVKQKDELRYAAEQVPIIEINSTFYSMQKAASFAKWREETPADFVFSVKGPKYITHVRRLQDVDVPLANFLASGIFNLHGKLGPILWQLPPHSKFDPERMASFLRILPRDTKQALEVARGHSDWMKERALLEIDENRPMRHAIEIRNKTFADAAFVDLLREHNVALVFAESDSGWPMFYDVTADFIYMRLHGDGKPEEGGYGDAALERWAQRVRAWNRGDEPGDTNRVSAVKPPGQQPRDVYGFFDGEDIKLRAPADARTLQRKVEAG